MREHMLGLCGEDAADRKNLIARGQGLSSELGLDRNQGSEFGSSVNFVEFGNQNIDSAKE